MRIDCDVAKYRPPGLGGGRSPESRRFRVMYDSPKEPYRTFRGTLDSPKSAPGDHPGRPNGGELIPPEQEVYSGPRRPSGHEIDRSVAIY